MTAVVTPGPPVVDPSSQSSGDNPLAALGGDAKPRRRRSPAPPVVQVISTAITTISVLLLGFSVYIGFVARLHHDRAQFTSYANFRKELALGTAPTGQTVPGDPKKLLKLGDPVAVLNIPALRLNEVVFEGTTGSVLENGPGHFRSTPLPGQPGVSEILGKSTTYGAPFHDLASLLPDDTFTVTTGQGVHKYKVLDVRRSGNPQPPLASGKGRLILATAEGGPFAPSGVVRVDAELTSEAQQKPKTVLTSSKLSRAERPMATDRAAWFWLVVIGEALAVAVVLISWVRVAWGRWQAWLVATPMLAFLGIAVADQAARLLPNMF